MPIYLLSFDESNVEQRGVEVEELEDVHFECKLVFIFSLSAVEFCRWIALLNSILETRERERERERERVRERGHHSCTPVGKLVGKKSVDFVHDENKDQLDASSSDSHYDITHSRSKGESIDQGIDSSSHSQTIQQHRQYNTEDNDDLWAIKF